MVRINIEEIKGITDDRKKSSCAAASDIAAATNEGGTFDKACCDGDECQIDWHKK